MAGAEVIPFAEAVRRLRERDAAIIAPVRDRIQEDLDIEQCARVREERIGWLECQLQEAAGDLARGIVKKGPRKGAPYAPETRYRKELVVKHLQGEISRLQDELEVLRTRGRSDTGPGAA
jgi:hypothetical protein